MGLSRRCFVTCTVTKQGWVPWGQIPRATPRPGYTAHALTPPLAGSHQGAIQGPHRESHNVGPAHSDWLKKATEAFQEMMRKWKFQTARM